jgi:hypothetical protein
MFLCLVMGVFGPPDPSGQPMKKTKPNKPKTETNFGKKLKDALSASEEKAKVRKQWANPGANNVGDAEIYFL